MGTGTLGRVRLLGYARRSTDEQPTTLDVQVEAVTGWAATGGHELVDVGVETVSGSTEPEDRPELSRLLDRLAAGEADALVVTTTDRCARTQAVHRLDYYGDREGWALLILDSLDRKQSPEAQLLHGIRVSVAAYERALIARRTRAALAYRKSIGVRIGRPRRCPDDVLDRVLELRAGGARLVDVAEAMNDAGVPTPGGGARWWPSHVSRLLATQDARTQTATAAPSTPRQDADAPSTLGGGQVVEAAAAGVDDEDQADDVAPAAAGRTVDLSAELGEPAGSWQVAETEPDSGSWAVLRDGARVGLVRRESTTRGRRGWLARLDTGAPLPAHGDLATAAGSTLWRTRDLAAAAIARQVAARPTRPLRTNGRKSGAKH